MSSDALPAVRKELVILKNNARLLKVLKKAFLV